MGRLFRRRRREPVAAAPAASFAELLDAAGLGSRADELAALALPGIRLRPAAGRAGVRLRETRLGGTPDLPPAEAWPAYRGRPQSFVAQIDLADVRRFDGDGLLPERGLLSFFYDSEQSVWGFDPADRGAWALVHTPEDVEVAPRSFPPDLPPAGRFAAVSLRAEQEPTYPSWESSTIDALGLTRDERDAYAEVWVALEEPAERDAAPVHRLLGHPDPIQGDMQLECQLVSHGIYCGDPSGYASPGAEALRPGAPDWTLLLQVDSDESAGTMWGDAGRIYYLLRRDALAAGRWDESWLVLQCY